MRSIIFLLKNDNKKSPKRRHFEEMNNTLFGLAWWWYFLINLRKKSLSLSSKEASPFHFPHTPSSLVRLIPRPPVILDPQGRGSQEFYLGSPNA